jgi:hypothetical protein
VARAIFSDRPGDEAAEQRLIRREAGLICYLIRSTNHRLIPDQKGMSLAFAKMAANTPRRNLTVMLRATATRAPGDYSRYSILSTTDER